MSEKLVIDLSKLVPPNGVSATIKFMTTEGAKALLHRFDGDLSPVTLHGPSGTVDVNISDSKKLFLERLDSADWEIACAGYSI